MSWHELHVDVNLLITNYINLISDLHHTFFNSCLHIIHVNVFPPCKNPITLVIHYPKCITTCQYMTVNVWQNRGLHILQIFLQGCAARIKNIHPLPTLYTCRLSMCKIEPTFRGVPANVFFGKKVTHISGVSFKSRTPHVGFSEFKTRLHFENKSWF